MKNETAQKISSVLVSITKRLSRVAKQTFENTEELSILRGTTANAYNELKASTEDFRVQAFQRTEVLATANAIALKQIADVKKENDDREARQALRDQNNVQSIINLRDSMSRAFNEVKKDIQELITRIDATNSRIKNVEVFQADLLERAKRIVLTPTPALSMPNNHVWVNKKLSGVYSQVNEQEDRIQKLEALIEKYENLRKAQAELAKAQGEFVS